MKIIWSLVFLVSFSTIYQAQFKPAFDKKIPQNQNMWLSQYLPINRSNHFSDSVVNMDKNKSLPDTTKTALTDTINTSLTDTLKYNMYGDLLNDNPEYNKKSSLGMVALRVTLANLSTFLIDRYIFNYNFSRVGFNSWKNNLKTGWEWDKDRFGMNYFFHPFSGGMYFNAARANGYSFFESAPFAVLGSLEWEYFGENTLPSYNDLINTPVNGIFLGEIFYRLGSNILDDQTTGADRFFRELAVAVITPTRFLSRFLEGKLTRSTTADVYQKEPLNITLSGGFHRVNEGISYQKGNNSINFTLQLDYGNPFEKRSRKPFDYFKLRTDLDFGVGRKIISLVTGNGILYAKNIQTGNLEMLTGLYQHMDFYDNKTFELGTIAFGPGIISKLPMTKSTSLYTNIHLDIIPFGALSKRFGPDTSQVRDYDYAGGAQATLESTFNIGGWVGVSFKGYYWWFSTFVGIAGNSYIGLIKPSIAFRIFNNVSIGIEHLIYYSDRYPRDFPSVHSVRTEQKIFLQIFLEEFKFKR
ncbi:MAG: DUF3943 domain-containing protein [Ignavibacteriales bacterium]|nr:DUF3943 domain-containing protein [Ignavibacteriales bacterium]